MSQTHRVKLSREVRFGLSTETPPNLSHTRNGFAGEPALTGIAPFLTLTARVIGNVDAKTGMLVNIRLIDDVLRGAAVDMVRAYISVKPGAGGGDLLVAMFASLTRHMAGETHLELAELELGLSPWLRLTITKERPEMVQMTERFEFSAAHRLMSPALSDAENRAVFGRCYNPNGHGHNYELEVTIEGEPHAQTGLVMHVGELQRLVNEHVIDVLDHKHLNIDCSEFATLNPTVENIARIIHEKLVPAFRGPAQLRRVRVWETPKTWAEYPA